MAKDDREERRAAALRANLRRRKGQARESAAGIDADSNGLASNAQVDADQPRVSDPAACAAISTASRVATDAP
jgi:hypothetical protein